MDNWEQIKTNEDVLAIIEKSKTKTQIIFKDSTTCGISAYAKERIIGGNDLLVSKADFNYLDLLALRPVSAFIAEELNVIHQSPQIIVVKDGKATHSVTHHSIHPEKIAAEL